MRGWLKIKMMYRGLFKLCKKLFCFKESLLRNLFKTLSDMLNASDTLCCFYFVTFSQDFSKTINMQTLKMPTVVASQVAL